MLLQVLQQYPNFRMVGSLHKYTQGVLLYLNQKFMSSTPPPCIF